MNAKELKKFEANPKAFVEALMLSHAEALKAKDEAHASVIAAKDTAHADELKAKDEAHASALQGATDLSVEKDQVIGDLQDKVDSLMDQLSKSATEDNRGVVPGTFKLNSGRVVQFKKGHTKVRFEGETYDSTELITNKELAPVMERLGEIGFGGFEDVESNK